MNRFREKVVDVIKEVNANSYEEIRVQCNKLKEEPEFKNNLRIQKLSFSSEWIAGLKRDFQIVRKGNVGRRTSHDIF